MENLFEYEEMDEEKEVKFAVTIFKGHVALWWDGVQTKRRTKNKHKIKS